MKHLFRSLLTALALTTVTAFAGELKYQIVPNYFDENPEGKQLGPCHGGAVIDRKGNIYVTTDTARGIIVYSAKGKFLRSFGPTRIHGLEIRREKGTEYIYAARPSDHEVIKLKLDGEQVWSIKYPHESGLYKDANGFKPCAVTAGPDGSIYVADGYGSNHILKFDQNQKFVKAFGGAGAGRASSTRATASRWIRAGGSRCCWSAIATTIAWSIGTWTEIS
jgi:DNA-binding beta-propeller fold protein YncE